MSSKEEIEIAKIDSKDIINELNKHKDKDFIGRLYYKNKPIENILQTLLQYINQLEKSDASKEQSSMNYYNKCKKLKQENNKQSKIIDEMAKEINAKVLTKEQWCPLLSKEKGCYEDDTCLKCLKQYFVKKVR